MKKEEIVSILCELHKISGLRVSLHGTDFGEIAAYPEERLPFCSAIQKNPAEYSKCVECDTDACKRVQASGETLVYKCRYGLTEVICPLYNFGTLSGYIMMGQVGDERVRDSALTEAMVRISKNEGEAKNIVADIPRISDDMLRSYIKIMTICAEYMTLTNALPSKTPRLPELAKIYLHERYAEKITIRHICKSLGCSKSALLSAFKEEYGTTINSYLCDVRINEAIRLLKNTGMSISEIAEETGFYDQSYFSKVFSQKVGVTPSNYRKENAK